VCGREFPAHPWLKPFSICVDPRSSAVKLFAFSSLRFLRFFVAIQIPVLIVYSRLSPMPLTTIGETFNL
jgi:hypothetical protein